MDLAQNEIINLKICSFKPKTEQCCTHSELGRDFQANSQLYCFPFCFAKLPLSLEHPLRVIKWQLAVGFFHINGKSLQLWSH